MRVIGGSAKGVYLKAPRGRLVRPTSDRVKEALFNILQFEIAGSKVLDLYAGTGSLGIEALSRGAQLAVFVEKNPLALRFLKENLNRSGLKEKATVYGLSVDDFLDQMIGCKNYFDLIFLDPPYKIKPEKLKAVLEKAAKLLNDGGVLVLEHKTKLAVDCPEHLLSLNDKRAYGDTSLSFFKLLR